MINFIRTSFLRRYEQNLAMYQHAIAAVSHAISNVDIVHKIALGIEDQLQEVGEPPAQSVAERFNVSMLEGIKRDIKVAIKSCELMQEEMENVDLDALKWWDFRFLDRIAKRQKNVVASMKTLQKQLRKFSQTTASNML